MSELIGFPVRRDRVYEAQEAEIERRVSAHQAARDAKRRRSHMRRELALRLFVAAVFTGIGLLAVVGLEKVLSELSR